MTKNKTIALDIGNVCLHIRHDKCLARLGFPADAAVPREFLEACGALETGLLSEEKWLAAFQKITGGRFSEQELLEAWNMILGEPVDGMFELAEELVDAGFRLVFFSDTSKIHLLEVFRKLPLCCMITGGTYSFEAGAQKPSDKMYEAFEREYGAPCFYTDDKPENIDGAGKRGWRGHRFVSAEDMRREIFSLLD